MVVESLSDHQKNFFIIGLVVVIVTAGYFLSGSSFLKSYDVRQIGGVVVSVEDDSITVKGSYIANTELPRRLMKEREITFYVDANTSFKKNVYQLPSREELIASGEVDVTESPSGGYSYSGTYKLDESAKTESTGSFADLAQSLGEGDVSIKAEFPSSIYSDDPRASMVIYTIMRGPKQDE
jgi:hypothetical protein